MKRLVLYLAVCASGFAADPPSVRDVLRSTGKAVEVFWDQFSAINCTEVVSQDKLGKEGKVEYRKDSTFDYVVLMRQADSDLAVEESRVSVPRPAVKQRNVPLLVTTGFSTLLFIFHPHFQRSYEFSPARGRPTGRQARPAIGLSTGPGRGLPRLACGCEGTTIHSSGAGRPGSSPSPAPF